LVEVAESEFDCLNLFIARPSAAALQQAGCNFDESLPVMVWIHGGGYEYGAGSDPPWGMSPLLITSFVTYLLEASSEFSC
jgi:carboxylesterase type B